MKKLRILLADDHDLVRLGLQALIEREPAWKVCASVANGRDAIEEAKKLRPEIVVLDMVMPGMQGLDVARQIRKSVPECEILIFTGTESDELIRNAYDAGAKSFILKSEAGKYLMDAIRSLAEHRPFFTDHASEVVFARFNNAKKERGQPEETGRLTPDEQKLLKLLADGNSNQSAAKKLRISTRTVENQRAEIMHKLKLDSFADLVRYAVRNKIIAP
jgi:DNA-binding NarL/FixJ family response regulator